MGLVIEYSCQWYFDTQHPPQTEFIDIEGRKLHFHKQGTGNHTVVFESGLGGDYLHWQAIQHQLSKKYTTISYDKAGILWSDYTDKSSLDRYEADLFQLLKKTNCPKPYILVGHSFAGITLRKFIQRHSSDIQGIVFVDVTHPSQKKESSENLKRLTVLPPKWILSCLNQTGVLRLIFNISPFTGVVSKEHWFNQNVTNYFYRILPGLYQEYANDDKLMEEASQITDFADIPLYIITARYPKGVEKVNDNALQNEYLTIHARLQKDLLRLSSNSTQLLANKSGHYVTFQEPELIVEAVNQIVNFKNKKH
jgi:pimeloyl-ACP methyl ester carboxylesterase